MRKCRRHEWEFLYRWVDLLRDPTATDLKPEARRCRVCRKIEDL